MTKIFYDTEFVEDGSTIELISIGMIDENGRELYAVNAEIRSDSMLYDKIRQHKWLMENVVRHLPIKLRGYGDKKDMAYDGARSHYQLDFTSNVVLPPWVIRNAVRAFILDTKDPELWADYAAYDHVVLAQLFGPMIDLPEGVPMFTHEFQQYKKTYVGEQPPKSKLSEHHALNDAKYLKFCYEWMENNHVR